MGHRGEELALGLTRGLRHFGRRRALLLAQTLGHVTNGGKRQCLSGPAEVAEADLDGEVAAILPDTVEPERLVHRAAIGMREEAFDAGTVGGTARGRHEDLQCLTDQRTVRVSEQRLRGRIGAGNAA